MTHLDNSVALPFDALVPHFSPLYPPGVDINRADKYGDTAIMRAACKGHAEVVRVLLAAPGIDVNKADNCDRTAIRQALEGNHTEVVRALLTAQGIDVNRGDKDGSTASLLAAYKDSA